MKKVTALVILILLLVSACTYATPAMTENYPATMIAMEVELRLLKEQMKATGEAIAASQAAPAATEVPPTEAPSPTSVITTVVVTATEAPKPTETAVPTATKVATGKISGSLNYPSSFIPAQRVIAFNIKTGYYYWQNTVDGMSYYSFDELPAGVYHVVSYLISDPKGFAGGYSHAVPCGLSVDCADHSLIDVVVKAGEETTGVNPFDWYVDLATSGWPADPTQK